jgi:hypothetical protein
MGIKIHTFGIEVSGRVNRTYDAEEDITTLTVDADQAEDIHESTAEILDFIRRQSGAKQSGAK